jgi:hypothetical protein
MAATVDIADLVAILGVAAVTVPAPGIGAAATETISGTDAAAVPAPGIAAAATETISGTDAAAVPSPGADAEAAAVISGDGAPAVAAPAAAATGSETIPGDADVTIAAPTPGATGSETIPGTGAVAAATPAIGGTATAMLGAVGSAAVPAPVIAAAATVSAVAEVPPWPDAEAILVALLADMGTVTTQTQPGTQLPVIRVNRVGGADTDRITDVARVSVIMYAATIAQAKQLAGRAQQRILATPAATADGVIDRARTETAPSELPTPDPAQVRAMSAIYRVSLRRRTAAA